MRAAATAGLCALVLAGPAAARVLCGDTLTGEAPLAGTLIEPLSRGRLAGELTLPQSLARDVTLARQVRAGAAREQARLARMAASRERAEGRLCWSREASIVFTDARLTSALLTDRTEVETLGRPSEGRSTLLWDRRRRRTLMLSDLLAPEAAPIVAAALAEDLVRVKRELDIALTPGERAAFAETITAHVQSGLGFTLRPSAGKVAGLVFHFGAGALGSRLEQAYELFVAHEVIAPHLRPEWRPLFATGGR